MRALQKGLSLVELMVALLIGVILTSGVISVYITSKSSYSMNMGLGQVQETGRFALSTLQPILVMGGNLGCFHPGSADKELDRNYLANTDPVYNMRLPVYGFEYKGTQIGKYYNDSTGSASNSPTVDNNASDWSPALSTQVAAALNGYAVKYSDVLVVHEMLANAAPVDAGGSSATAFTFAATNAPAMAAGQVMIASSCSGIVYSFVASTYSSSSHTISVTRPDVGTPGNYSDAALGGSWGANFGNLLSTVGPAQTYVFFVGKSPIDGGTSLFEASLNTSGANVGKLGTPVEIVPGVENMQILYGVDTVNDALNPEDHIPSLFETADTIDSASTCPHTQGVNVCVWDEVVSVRVALIVHSDPNAVDAAPSATTAIHMLGTGFTDSFSYRPYADRRMRRYFAQTFSLRNTLP